MKATAKMKPGRLDPLVRLENAFFELQAAVGLIYGATERVASEIEDLRAVMGRPWKATAKKRQEGQPH